MTEAERLFESLDQAHWELSEAFKNFPASDLWTRPHPKLLSAGEQASHVAHWEAQSFLPAPFESILVPTGEFYYPSSIKEALSLPLEPAEAWSELKRIHELCRQEFFSVERDLADANALRGTWTWRYTLQYQAFHVAYHAGQIYSVRHLLGHVTPDN